MNRCMRGLMFAVVLMGVAAAQWGCSTQPLTPGEFRADRLLLTWQQDPTSTMTIQWLHPGSQLPIVPGMAAEPHPFDVPYVGDVELGRGASWWDRGLALDFLANDRHDAMPGEALAAQARLGWNEEGLIFVARVQDDTPGEHADIDQLWDGDSVELFVSAGVGAAYRYQVAASPGRGPDQSEPRHFFYAYGGPGVDDLSVEVVGREDLGGYVIELMLPWSNVPELNPEQGLTFAFQLYVNGRDHENTWRWVGLHPARNASGNPHAAYPLRLAAQRSAPVQTRATIEDVNGRAFAVIHAANRLAGNAVELFAGDRRIASGRLEADGSRAVARIRVPAAPRGQRWGMLEVRHTDGERLAWLEPPSWLGFQTPGPSKIMYWRAGDDPAEARTVNTRIARVEAWGGMYRQRVELTGLAPDTEYRFRTPDADRDYGFRTLPQTLNRPIRFAVGGDTRHQQDWMENTNRAAMAYEPDFIVWGGDFAYADGVESNIYRWEEWFDANYNTLIDDHGIVTPIIGAIGNHEVQRGYYTAHEGFQPTDTWRQRIAPYFYQFFAFPGQPGYGTLDIGDYLSFVILDTEHTNPIAGPQTQWLENELSQRQHIPHVFPIYHVPGFPSHRSYTGGVSTRVREHWVPLFEAYGIRLAFEHHDHTYKRTPPIRDGEINPDGVVYLGDGAWGVGVRPVHDPAETWYLEKALSERHAIIVTIDGERQHVLTVNEDGQVIDEYERP